MSGATYRIEVEHDPHGPSEAPWFVRLFTLSNDTVPVMTGYYASREEAAMRASTWIMIEKTREETKLVMYADDEGRRAYPPDTHSVKV